jgi:hypothetical protein
MGYLLIPRLLPRLCRRKITLFVSVERSDANIANHDLHCRDLLVTVVTRFYIAGIAERVIAEIVGWFEEQVSKIRCYVGSATTKVLMRKINEGGRDPQYRPRDRSRNFTA